MIIEFKIRVLVWRLFKPFVQRVTFKPFKFS